MCVSIDRTSAIKSATRTSTIVHVQQRLSQRESMETNDLSSSCIYSSLLFCPRGKSPLDSQADSRRDPNSIVARSKLAYIRFVLAQRIVAVSLLFARVRIFLTFRFSRDYFQVSRHQVFLAPFDRIFSVSSRRRCNIRHFAKQTSSDNVRELTSRFPLDFIASFTPPLSSNFRLLSSSNDNSRTSVSRSFDGIRTTLT